MSNYDTLGMIKQRLEILYQMVDELERSGGGGGEPGTTNYNDLTNKPSVNGHILIGSKTSSDLDLQPVISDLSTIRSGAALGATAVQPSDMEEALSSKQDTLTFDSTPTSGSTNPVTSGGVYTSLTTKVDKVAGKGLSTNDFTDSEKAQIEKNTEGIAAVVNRGSKNLLPIKNHAVGDVTETNGFRFTLQADGGILVEETGTHSANGDYYLIGQWGNRDTLIDCSDGTYTATLEANDDTVSKVSMRIYKAGNNPIISNLYTNTSANFTGEIAFVFITAFATGVIPSGGVVVYPMIRPASITDDTYVPYAPTNRELYEMILSLQSGS